MALKYQEKLDPNTEEGVHTNTEAVIAQGTTSQGVRAGSVHQCGKE